VTRNVIFALAVFLFEFKQRLQGVVINLRTNFVAAATLVCSVNEDPFLLVHPVLNKLMLLSFDHPLINYALAHVQLLQVLGGQYN
jgi:hypothetical protein